MKTLINLLGGPTSFVSRLDYLHDQNITYIGNEPAFLTVFQYHYAGRPARSTSRVRTYIPDYFSPTPAGLPGNDDSGAMGSFVAMAMMGLFPNPGQSVYLLTVPFFESVSIISPLTGKTATLRTVNWAEYNSANATGAAVGGNGFIQSATLDGKPYTRSWIGHDFFTEGRDLVLVLGKEENAWGTKPEDLPPSLAEDSVRVDSAEVNGRRWESVVGDSRLDGVAGLIPKHALHLGHHVGRPGYSHSGKGGVVG